MSIWNVQPYLHAGYQYLHQVDVRWEWNGWNGWNTLGEIYYSLYSSTTDKSGKSLHIYFTKYLMLETWKLLSIDRAKRVTETEQLTVKLV
jgi:hypothetical protein